jgi:two-component system nitrate/nitrite response regulator NarL
MAPTRNETLQARAVEQKSGPSVWPKAQVALRVLLVSDIRLFREAFAALLERECDIEVAGMTSAPQVLAIAGELSPDPDIVLFDATRPGNLEFAKALVSQMPATKVVAFGVAEADAEIVALAAAGIAGYLRNDAAIEDVMAVLRSAMRDELLCSPRAAATLCHHVALLSRDTQSACPKMKLTLSQRELQIAELLDRGLSNKQIARQLGIQAATVKNHVHNILDKLNVHRRGEAAACLRAALRARPPDNMTDAPSI